MIYSSLERKLGKEIVMKKSLLFASSVLALFTSVGANALSWTGSEDLSSINAQIVDTGTTDYVLSSVDGVNPITDQVYVNGSSMGLVNSFTYSAGDEITDTVSGGVLYFNAFEANDVTLSGDVTNTYSSGSGIDIRNNSVIHNDLSIDGTINTGSIGVWVYGATVGSFTSTADITSTGSSAMYLRDMAVTNDINVSGTINSTGSSSNGIALQNVTADSFASTADITAPWGIRFDSVDIAGAITIGGTFSTSYPYSDISFAQFDSTAGSVVVNSGYFMVSTNASLTVAGAVDINSSDGAYLVNLTADSLTLSAANINSGHYGFYMKDSVLANDLDLSALTTVTAGIGLDFNNVVSANGIDLSSITTITANGGTGLGLSWMAIPTFASAADITASTYGVLLSRLDGTGTIGLSGTIDAGYSGINLSSSTIDSLIILGDITAGTYYGVQLSNASVTDTLDVGGTISSVRSGIYAYNGSIGSLTSTSDITSSTEAGIYLRSMTMGTSTLSGTIAGETYGLYLWTTAGGDIISTADITANTEDGIYLYSGSSIDSLVNNGSITSVAKAAIAADSGNHTLAYSGTGTLSGATYDIDLGGGTDTVNISNATINDLSVNSVENINVAADATIGGTGLVATGVTTSTAITNDGSIAGIVMDDTNEVLSYTGTGTLSGATYDIDMGAGADVLNISGVTMAAPSINNAERVNISNSILQLDLTDANKGTTLLTFDGTTQLDLFNVTFDMNSTATLADGDELVLASIAGIDGTNLNTLMMNLTGFDGAFSIVDNAGTEELIFTLGGDVATTPSTPSTPSMPTASDAFVSSGAVATQISTTADNVIQGRMTDKRYQGKRQEFAALYSDSMYDIYEEPRSQLWVQGFGLSGTYDGDVAKGLNGYETSLNGVVVGYDYNWGTARTGFAVTHATGEIEEDQNVFNIEIESLSGSLYSVFDFDNMYIETAASFGVTTFDQDLSGVASSYDSTSMGGLMRVGLKLNSGHFGFEQYAGFQYKNVIVEEHENGVDTIAEYNQEMFKGELGFVTSYQMLLASGDAIVPYLRLEIGNDFAKDATLTSLDNSGAAVGSLETVDLGSLVSRVATGVSFLANDNYSIGAEYEYEARDKYQAHIGKIKGRLRF